MVLEHKLGIQKNKRFTDFNTYFVQKHQKKKTLSNTLEG